MEEQKKKRKKIGNLLLKIAGIIAICLLTIITINYCAKTTKAEEIEVNYKNYTMLVSVEQSDLVNDTYEGQITIVATINNNTLTYINIDDNYPEFTCDNTILFNGPYETYGATSIDTHKMYFITTEEDYPSVNYTIIGASEINTFYTWFYGEQYTDGINVNNTTAYNQGYTNGQRDNQYINDRTLATMQEQYDKGIAEKQAVIDSLNEQLQNQNLAWGNYKSLLGTIFLFPIQFFKEGFNVSIFGINVGSFIVGVGILVIVITIIGFVLSGKISRGGKNE